MNPATAPHLADLGTSHPWRSPAWVSALRASGSNPGLPLLTSFCLLLLLFLLLCPQSPAQPGCILCAVSFVPVAVSSIHMGLGVQEIFFKKYTRKSSESDSLLSHLDRSPHLAHGGPRPALPSLGLCVSLPLPWAGAYSWRPEETSSELSKASEYPVLTYIVERDLGLGTEVRGQQAADACEF